VEVLPDTSRGPRSREVAGVLIALREGRPADALAIAELWLESARAGFGSLLPGDYAWPDVTAVVDRTTAAMGEEGVHLVVAEGSLGLLGYTGFGASRDPDAAPGVGEVRTLFVHPSAWRSGVGHALLDRALAALRADGYLEATVWSFVANQRANAFYEAHRMTRDGARRREAVWNELDEVRYRLVL
jgi:GNAT superfamily N-acetyltransferase